MSEIETSFVSACSTLQLLAKLLDFQKNICKLTQFKANIDADTFIKELAKIDPKVMRRYNFESFMER